MNREKATFKAKKRVKQQCLFTRRRLYLLCRRLWKHGTAYYSPLSVQLLFFWENSANRSALCQVISTVQTSLFELDKCTEIWLLSYIQWKKKDPIKSCTTVQTQGLIKVSVLKELCNTSIGKQNIRQNRKKKKSCHYQKRL